jgi:superfamily II DNA/RNA helicase
MNSFNDLKLPAPISKALEKMGFETPTPIQAQAIPPGLLRRDLIGCAQTGTGKTAAFCIPIAARLSQCADKTALILAPTRELAAQIEEVWKSLTMFLPDLRSTTIIGGVAMRPQVASLRRGSRVLIATPGRLVDHLNRGYVSLSKTEILVLDEADRMLDMGFAPQLAQILRFLPKTRQTLLFSATMPHEIDRLTEKYLKDPVRVTVGKNSAAAEKISQSAINTTAQKKNDTLVDELNHRKGSILVFARTQARTDRLARYLGQTGLAVNRIHGGRSQGQRKSALAAFKNGDVRILVATDIAARGIDVADISHVINYDLPMVAEDYIHRIGRTARAGTEGQAISLITPEDRAMWQEIGKLLKKSGSATPQMAEAAPSSVNHSNYNGTPPQVRLPAQRPQRPGNRPISRNNSNRNTHTKIISPGIATSNRK